MKISWSKVIHKNEMYVMCSVLLFMWLASFGENYKKNAVSASELIRFISELLFVFVRYFVTHRGKPEYLLCL